MGIISWIVKNKTKEVIKGILQGIVEFWNDCCMKPRNGNDTYTESEDVEREYARRRQGLRKKKDPTDVMRGY